MKIEKRKWREEIHETEKGPNKINVDVTFSFYVSRAYSNARRFNVDHIPNTTKAFETNQKFHKQPGFFQMLRGYNAANILNQQPAYQEIVKEGIIVSMKYKYFMKKSTTKVKSLITKQ